MKIFAIGASKNIGYYSATHMLAAGHSVAFMLRSPKAFDEDQTMQEYIKKGKVTIFKGDALSKQDVENAWKGANENSKVDLVLFTVGGTPKFYLRKGLVISPANLTTHSISNILQTIASNCPGEKPRMIAITSTGVTKDSHDALPFGFKLFYSYGLASPHADKLGMERLLQYAMGKEWKENIEPSEDILPSPSIWTKEYPPTGWLPELVIVRPAFLTDGEEVHQYKVSMDEFASYTISRKDMGHFIGKKLMDEWNTWSGKIVNVGN